MAFVKVEPSGCVERKGLVQIRLAMYLEEGDYGYEKHHVQVYARALTEAEMDDPALAALVSKKWQNNPFHNHFIYVEPSATDKEITDQMAFHLPNFYEAWKQGWGEVRGSMRKGWDVKTRARPKHYANFADYPARKALALTRVERIKGIHTQIEMSGEGGIFPATTLNIGLAAIDRASYYSLANRTMLLKDNACNGNGTIDEHEVWISVAGNDAVGYRVGTFYFVSGADYKCRDSETIGGVTAGSKQTFSALDMNVVIGDLIGAYCTYGYPERDSGLAGLLQFSGEAIDTNDQATYTTLADKGFSLYGTGEATGVTHNGSTTLTGVGTLSAIGIGIYIGKATLTGTGALATLGGLLKTGAVTLSGTGLFNVVGGFLKLGAIALVGSGLLSVKGVRVLIGKTTLAGLGTLITKARMTYGRILNLGEGGFISGLDLTEGGFKGG